MPETQQAEWDLRYAKRRNKFTRLVAEGDSWFAYPLWDNIVDILDTSTNEYAIRRLGESGRRLSSMVDDGNYLQAVKEERPRALLISGGGNDFVNKKFVTGADGDPPLFNHMEAGAPAEDLINETKWLEKLDELTGLFEKIIRRVDGKAPILTHGYDFIVPSSEGARYDGVRVTGPWVLPTMQSQGIDDPQLQREVAAVMIHGVNDLLTALAVANAGQFFYVSLLGTLQDVDWANEIHPFREGFAACAEQLADALEMVLNGNAAPVIA